MISLPRVSFGAVSAVVTSIGLIVGFGAADISKPTIIAGLLIVGLADNLTNSLSIHIYQESERLEQHAAFVATLSNFVTRLVISHSRVQTLSLPPWDGASCYLQGSRGSLPKAEIPTYRPRLPSILQWPPELSL